MRSEIFHVNCTELDVKMSIFSIFSGSIVGARTLEYLLEKSRMVTQVNMMCSSDSCHLVSQKSIASIFMVFQSEAALPL